MKFIIERGSVVGTKDEKWTTEDGRSGTKLKLVVKERTGEDEFSAVVIHELDIFVEKPEDYLTFKSMYDTYKDKVCRIEGNLYSRKFTKDKKTSVFSTFYVDTIEIV